MTQAELQAEVDRLKAVLEAIDRLDREVCDDNNWWQLGYMARRALGRREPLKDGRHNDSELPTYARMAL